MGVSENSGFSSQIIHFNRGFIINHPFRGTPTFGNPIYLFLPVFSCASRGISQQLADTVAEDDVAALLGDDGDDDSESWTTKDFILDSLS